MSIKTLNLIGGAKHSEIVVVVKIVKNVYIILVNVSIKKIEIKI